MGMSSSILVEYVGWNGSSPDICCVGHESMELRESCKRGRVGHD